MRRCKQRIGHTDGSCWCVTSGAPVWSAPTSSEDRRTLEHFGLGVYKEGFRIVILVVYPVLFVYVFVVPFGTYGKVVSVADHQRLFRSLRWKVLSEVPSGTLETLEGVSTLTPRPLLCVWEGVSTIDYTSGGRMVSDLRLLVVPPVGPSREAPLRVRVPHA